MKKKTLLLVLSLTLVLGIIVGGTIAWLKDSTEEVVNTFTVGDIDIDLKEHPLKAGDDYDGKTIDTSATPVTEVDNYKMLPGRELQKDPFVTVKANSEECWLFVKIEKSTNFDDYMTFSVITGNNGWTALSGVDGVYYREVSASTSNQEFKILVDDLVTVKSDVTKEDLADAKTNPPTLTFKAYAIQKEGFDTAAAAWTEASKAETTNP